MKIRCIHDTGISLKDYENKKLGVNELGKFGATSQTVFGVTIGKDYLVMGMLMGEGVLDYLIDEDGDISAYPSPLFEVLDGSLPSNWFFKSYKYTDENYPYREAIWGYHELVFDDSHYNHLIEGLKDAEQIYYRRKIELEKILHE